MEPFPFCHVLSVSLLCCFPRRLAPFPCDGQPPPPAPIYGGWVDSLGPRNCPSIEDKIVKFAGKDSHPVFLEPEGRRTPELYVQARPPAPPPPPPPLPTTQTAFFCGHAGFRGFDEGTWVRGKIGRWRNHTTFWIWFGYPRLLSLLYPVSPLLTGTYTPLPPESNHPPESKSLVRGLVLYVPAPRRAPPPPPAADPLALGFRMRFVQIHPALLFPTAPAYLTPT